MTNTTTKKKTGALFAALDLSNAVRRAHGEPELEELPLTDSIKMDPSRCILALAFNFDCSVDWGHEYEPEEDDVRAVEKRTGEGFGDHGVVIFGKEEIARTFAEQAGVPELVWSDDGIEWKVALADSLIRLATAFDEGRLVELADDLELALFAGQGEELLHEQLRGAEHFGAAALDDPTHAVEARVQHAIEEELVR